MSILTIIVVVWSFFVSTNDVVIKQAKNFETKVNCEAILEKNNESIVVSEEVTPLFIKRKLELNANMMDRCYCDKELPAT